MIIDKKLLDTLTQQAKESPRLRMNYDLRNSAEDQSQRMLNALEPGTVLPIHRHRKTTETVAILRGRAVQYIYDDAGNQIDAVLLAAGSGDAVMNAAGSGEGVAGSDDADLLAAVPAMSVEKGQWHRLESLESGTVIIEMKDGPYEPIQECDILG